MKKDHSVSHIAAYRQTIGKHQAKIEAKINYQQLAAEKRTAQMKLGVELDAKPREEQRQEKRQAAKERKKALKAQQQQERAISQPVTHQEKLSVAKKQKKHLYEETKLRESNHFVRNVLMTAVTMQLLSTVVLPVAAEINSRSLNSRNDRPQERKSTATSTSAKRLVDTTPTRIFDTDCLSPSQGYTLSPGLDFTGTLPGEAGASVAVLPISDSCGWGNIGVGSPGENRVGTVGRVDIIYPTNQTEAPVVPLYNHSNGNGARLDSAAYGAGQNVRAIGDFDGDGVGDYLVTARHSAAASIDIVYGTQNGTYPDGLDLDNAPADQVLHVMQTDPFSKDDSPVYLDASANTVGDANQDKKSDVLFPGCADPNDKRQTRGNDNLCLLYGTEKYRLYGIGTVDLSKVNYDGIQGTLIYPTELNYRGTSPLSTVAPLPNITGNGLDSFAVGNPYAFNGDYDPSQAPEGTVYIFEGQTGGYLGVIKNTRNYLLNGGGFVMYGATPGDRTGTAIASQFDLNQDGVVDMGVGVPQDGISKPGEVRMIWGPLTEERFPGREISLGNLTASQGSRLGGECAGDNTGAALAPSGNFYNDDAHGGLGIGTNGGGKAFVVASKANPSPDRNLGSMPPEEAVKLINSEGSASFGSSLDFGKVNGNQNDDGVIGDPGLNGGWPAGPGEVKVLFDGIQSTVEGNSQCPPKPKSTDPSNKIRSRQQTPGDIAVGTNPYSLFKRNNDSPTDSVANEKRKTPMMRA